MAPKGPGSFEGASPRTGHLQTLRGRPGQGVASARLCTLTYWNGRFTGSGRSDQRGPSSTRGLMLPSSGAALKRHVNADAESGLGVLRCRGPCLRMGAPPFPVVGNTLMPPNDAHRDCHLLG